ncbi:hypothetical protein [Bradyrhizobium sp. USDA 3315]
MDRFDNINSFDAPDPTQVSLPASKCWGGRMRPRVRRSWMATAVVDRLFIVSSVARQVAAGGLEKCRCDVFLLVSAVFLRGWAACSFSAISGIYENW